MDNEGKRVDLYLHAEDRKIIDATKRRYGCSTTAAIRACIRIAADVKLNLERAPLTKGD